MPKILKIEDCNVDGCPVLRLATTLECDDAIFQDEGIIPGPGCPLDDYPVEKVCEVIRFSSAINGVYYAPDKCNALVTKDSIYCRKCGGKIKIKEE